MGARLTLRVVKEIEVPDPREITDRIDTLIGRMEMADTISDDEVDQFDRLLDQLRDIVSELQDEL